MNNDEHVEAEKSVSVEVIMWRGSCYSVVTLFLDRCLMMI